VAAACDRGGFRFLATRFGQLLLVVLAAGFGCATRTFAQDAFHRGVDEYAAGHFQSAAQLFREASSTPAAGTLYNLGDAEWRCDRPGPAILAWEQALWLNPFDRKIPSNLRYARKVRQLDAPELAWYEICSTWLPVNWWAWLSCSSLWLAVALMMLPGILGWRKAGWQQGLAAASFAIFLLTIPALAGIHTRSKLGIILSADTPLRLTPTTDAQVLAPLPAGEAARLERAHGAYIFIKTASASGWVERTQLGVISQ
jgi:tetratricopeptide (TPR) repeat protein